MNIIDLRQAPQHIPTLARWFYDEWGYLNPSRSLPDYEKELAAYLADEVIPTLLIATFNDQILGSAALVESDMSNHLDIGPWLANVYVHPDQRGKGLGRKLVRSIMSLAQRHQLSPLYLFTPDRSLFYENMGWTHHAQEIYRGAQVTIMQLNN